MNLLGLKDIKQNNLLYILNENLRKNYMCTYDNKQMIRIDDIRYMPSNYDEKQFIHFHPLNNLKESCSYLLMDDSIHLYLRNLAFNIFKKIITTKDGTIIKHIRNIPLPDMLDTYELDNLSNPSKNTKRKFTNLFNIVTATSFAKNLIRFEIKFTDPPQYAKINFQYPLYEMLREIQNNTLFGIYFEDNEIRLFKQIYENYIIAIIDNLFQEPIDIPMQSDHYPKFYILATIKLMLWETYWKKYNISWTYSAKEKIERYKDMISDLNQYSKYNEFTSFKHIYTEIDQKFDQEIYRNEIQIRQECSPDWLAFKDNIMKRNINTRINDIVVEKTNDLIETFAKNVVSNYEKYIKKTSTFLANESIKSFIQNYQINQNNQEWSEIFYWQELALDILYVNGGGLWYDTRIKKYCFRSKWNGSTINVDSKELGKILTRALKDKITDYLNQSYNDFSSKYAIEIVLVFKLKGINSQKLNINEKANNIVKILVFENEITTIDDDIFDPRIPHEFIKNNTDLLYTRNRFSPNEYLIKRQQQNYFVDSSSTEQTFIEKFLYHLVKEKQELCNYIMNWLAYYFQNLQKSKTALVLLGEQEVTQGIFWKIIIKEIFSQQYCTTISDKEHDTASVASIAKDKLFFHVSDIVDADAKFNNTALASIIIKNLLIKPSVTDDTGKELEIHGQMIITAKNPAPYLKKVLSKCTVIEINNMDTIIENLDLEDEGELEDMIRDDLHNFTNQLLQYRVRIDRALKKVDTEARQTLKSNKSPNINKEDIDKKLDTFIQAIKNKDIEYFEEVRDSNDLIYEHMKNAFNQEEGYFINQYLFECYNSIYANQPFGKKNQFMSKLKEKDDMFKQEVKTLKILDNDKNEQVLFQSYKTSKETGNKELYKIKDYKLASDIIIPNEVTILSSQENIRKFCFENDEDRDKCIERTKKYRQDRDTKK